MPTDTGVPEVSIIVPALNEERHIAACFSAIARLTTPVDRFEVLLIDNGSTDRTLQIASEYSQRFNLAIYAQPGIHISAMRNFGVQKSRGKILAFLDADCIVSDEWLNRAMTTFNNVHSKVSPQKLAMVGSAYHIPLDSTWVGKSWYLNPSNQPVTGVTSWIPSGNMFVAREAYLTVGGFDETVQTDEDYELCQRIRARGYIILSDPNIVVVHLGTPQSISSFYRKEHWHGRDVFKIFLESDRTLKNTKAVVYALLYVVFIFGFVATAMLAVGTGELLPLALCVVSAVCVPTILAIKTSFAARQYKYTIGLFILYTVFGVARALCILNVSTWAFQSKKKINFEKDKSNITENV